MTHTSQNTRVKFGSKDPDEPITVCTATTIRRTTTTEHGPRPFKHGPIDYQTRNQTFASLYCTVTRVIEDCGACSRSDLAMIPALSRYSPFQLERALLTAEHHGLIRRIGSIHPNHPDAADTDDPDAQQPGIYDVDPLGIIDRSNAQDTIRRAMACRTPLEVTWLSLTGASPSHTHDPAALPSPACLKTLAVSPYDC